MTPLTFCERIGLWWANLRFQWWQCKVEHSVQGGYFYCQRNRFHHGPHIDCDGAAFHAQVNDK